MKSRIFSRIAAIICAISVSVTPLYALPLEDAIASFSTVNAREKISLDTPIENKNDGLSHRYAVDQIIFDQQPEVYLSSSDWGNVIFSYYDSTPSELIEISCTEYLKSIWDNQEWEAGFWAYVDTVIAGADVKSTDSQASQVSKIAKFIGRNYRYDDDYAEAKWYEGVPFFTTLAQDQKSFCMTDSRLFMACCLRLGIPCHSLEGYASGLHEWNKVFVNGTWSEVDVSFARKAANPDRYILFNSGRTVYHEVG